MFLRLPGSANPNGESILFSSPSWNDGGGTATVIRVEDSPYVILDGFRILRELHASTRSQVYQVEDVDSGKHYCLKTPSVKIQA